jgi:hypothetical protein
MTTKDNTPDQPIEVEDRRAAIAAAFEEHSEPESAPPSVAAKTTTEEPKGGHVATEEGGPDAPTPTTTEAPNDAPGSKSTQSSEESPKPLNTDRPPQAWKAPQKAKWEKLDPDIRQEVLRRERETTQVLNDSAQARQLAQQFQQTVQPFMGRLQSMNAHPLVAVGELLKADYLLSTAPKAQRAQFMAKLIKDYDVDLLELDGALSGKGPADPVESRVEQLLAQRLAPFQQFISQQQMAEQQRAQQLNQQLEHTVETMAQDPEYPYFERVRDTMADIIEVLANRGQHISIEAAYNRAIAMDPAISQEIAAKSAAEAQVTQAATLNKRAQQALKASSSVGGAPSGSTGKPPNATDRRATIAAAFDAAGGR